MISAHNLSVSFDSNEVLKNINLSVKKGEILVILGKNGSGKSVLLKSIAGLIEDYDGEVFLDEYRAENNIYYSIDNTLASYVFQKGGLFDSFTVYDNIAFGMRRKNLEENVIREKIMDALENVGLEGSENKLPSELSGGMQKRVGLARAICMDPRIILYDDPTAGLDPVLTDQIADLVLSIRDKYGITSAAVTHDLKFAEKIADNIILLYRGEAAFYGKCNDFFSKSNPYALQFIEGDTEGPIDIY